MLNNIFLCVVKEVPFFLSSCIHSTTIIWQSNKDRLCDGSKRDKKWTNYIFQHASLTGTGRLTHTNILFTSSKLFMWHQCIWFTASHTLKFNFTTRFSSNGVSHYCYHSTLAALIISSSSFDFFTSSPGQSKHKAAHQNEKLSERGGGGYGRVACHASPESKVRSEEEEEEAC